jgi:hypothetical protein
MIQGRQKKYAPPSRERNTLRTRVIPAHDVEYKETMAKRSDPD